MYKSYLNYIRNIDLNNIKSINFKSNKKYTGILEHVSHELGLKYLNLIENEYSNIDFTNIIEFIKINDYYGNPIKYNYNFKFNYNYNYKFRSTSVNKPSTFEALRFHIDSQQNM